MKYVSKVLFGIAGMSLFIAFKVDSYNLFFIITSLLSGGLAYFISTSIDNKELIKSNKKLINNKNKLLKNGLKIKIDLNTCRVISNNYREQIVNENSHMDKYKALDSLIGRDTREFSNIVQTVIVFEQEIEGKKSKFYSRTFNKDEASIRLYLSQKKTAWLYVDTQDSKNYYFNI